MDRSLSYPIGEHVPKASYAPAERAALIARLAAQPAALAAALSGLDAAAFEQPYRPGGWTVRQVVHHVADSHINMFIRVKFALSVNEPTIMPYDQDAWVAHPDVAAVPPMVSVTLLASLHERLVALFRALTPEQFSRALMHPENGRMTIEQVLALYAWHGDHHIAHITGFRTRA
jgi:uncharacterized damage-inducible protein DinB